MRNRRPQGPQTTPLVGIIFLGLVGATAFLPAPVGTDGPSPPPGCETVSRAKAADDPTAESIIRRMLEANRLRDLSLKGYTAKRNYRAQNFRFNKQATMEAEVKFESPASKNFTILSEEGSDTIRKAVFQGIMDGEVEALEPDMKRRSAISLENYRFKLIGKTQLGGRACYELEAEPQRKDKFLFRGRLWIDACDFAVMRVRGSPAKLPSVWTRKVDLERDYQKVQDFWLPAKDEAESQLLIFGRSHVLVTHSDYHVETVRSRDRQGVAPK